MKSFTAPFDKDDKIQPERAHQGHQRQDWNSDPPLNSQALLLESQEDMRKRLCVGSAAWARQAEQRNNLVDAESRFERRPV